MEETGNRVVSTEEGAELAASCNAPFYECSAVTGRNISNAFEKLSILVVETIDDAQNISGAGNIIRFN